MMVAERKYAMTKITAGDYLLPSNDRETMWRIAKRIDGPSFGPEDWPRDREVWALYRWVGTTADLYRWDDNVPGGYVAIDSWEHWSLVTDWLDTRADAIKEALA